MATSVACALAWGRGVLRSSGIDSPDLDASVLLSHCLGVTRTDLVTRPERILCEDDLRSFRELVNRRSGHEPVAYITGHREFYGRDFIVAPRVLIPRPETELLVDVACEKAPARGMVFEIGVGSGAVICSILAERTDVRGMGNDIDVEALRIARANARGLGVEGRLLLYAGRTLAGCIAAADIIVANPPYLSDEDLAGAPPEVSRFEPRKALWGGKDGLDVVKEIIVQAPSRLVRRGALIMETGFGQSGVVESVARGSGMFHVEGWREDLAGIKRVVILRLRDG